MEAEGILTARIRIVVVRAELPFRLFWLPPLALLSAQYLAGVSLTEAIPVMLWFGAVSLGWWGFLVVKRFGLAGWQLAISTGAGLSIGIVVLRLQVFLQPDTLISG